MLLHAAARTARGTENAYAQSRSHCMGSYKQRLNIQWLCVPMTCPYGGNKNAHSASLWRASAMEAPQTDQHRTNFDAAGDGTNYFARIDKLLPVHSILQGLVQTINFKFIGRPSYRWKHCLNNLFQIKILTFHGLCPAYNCSLDSGCSRTLLLWNTLISAAAQQRATKGVRPCKA